MYVISRLVPISRYRPETHPQVSVENPRSRTRLIQDPLVLDDAIDVPNVCANRTVQFRAILAESTTKRDLGRTSVVPVPLPVGFRPPIAWIRSAEELEVPFAL
jgi:hypothetical protein